VTIRGRVTSGGRAVAGVEVRTQRTSEGWATTSPSVTDAAGGYELSVDGPGQRHLSVRAEDGSYAEGTVSGLVLETGGNLAVSDIVLRPGGTICGHVSPDGPGDEVRGTVHIRSADGLVNGGYGGDRVGWFEFSRLPPGTYSLTVMIGDRESAPRQVRIEGSETVKLELSPP